jgi:hypothetical protein
MKQEPKMPANSALVSDACVSALRAFCSAPQRGRLGVAYRPSLRSWR